MNEQLTNEQLTPEQKKIQKKSHRTLVILAFLFAIPYAAAFYMYYGDDVASSLDTSNNGQLVSPIRPMETMLFKNINNDEETSMSFSEGWTMLTLAPSNCDIECTDNLYAMKQVRRAIGVDRNIVHRIMLLTDHENIEQLKTKIDDFYGMDILTTSTDNLEQLRNFLQLDGQSLKNAVFLFDPQGNYMMYYGTSTHPKLILKDMQLLLKLSKH